MKRTYETPRLAQLGEITDLTQGQGWRGNSDSIRISFWGLFSIDISYGTSG